MYNFFKPETRIEVFPVLQVQHLVFFPHTSTPLILSVSAFLKIKIKPGEEVILLFPKTNKNNLNPQIATLCSLQKVKLMPQGRVKLFLKGLQRTYIEKHEKNLISIRKIHEKPLPQEELFSLQQILSYDLEALHKLGKILSPELLEKREICLEKLEGLLIHSFDFTVEEQSLFLSTQNPIERFQRIHAKIKTEIFRRKEGRKTELT